MQVPILNGIYTNTDSDFRTSYPRNMVPIPKIQGISQGYLRPADGALSWTTGAGIGRGAINWKDQCYRVQGTKLQLVNYGGAVTTLGDVGGSGQVSIDYSFDRLAVASDGAFYYWDGTTLTQVTDPDLGTVWDFIWVDGYFLCTDGGDMSNLFVTELNDPTAVDPLKYGSSEVDPDNVQCILKWRNQPVAVNRYTCEFFDNQGGNLFPFVRIIGAQLTKGAVGKHAACIFNDTVTFVGSGRNKAFGEAVAVWSGVNGETVKISTREVDQVLEQYMDAQLSQIVVETQTGRNQSQLHIRLPDRTLVYDASASAATETPVWFELTGGLQGYSQCRIANRIRCYGKWIVDDPQSNAIGFLTESTSKQWGGSVGWEFGTIAIYNSGSQAIVHEVELVALTGNIEMGKDPTIWTSYSEDGLTRSQPHYIQAGKQGNRTNRLRWLGQGLIRNWRTQHFGGDSDAHLSFARCDMRIEGLNW